MLQIAIEIGEGFTKDSANLVEEVSIAVVGEVSLSCLATTSPSPKTWERFIQRHVNLSVYDGFYIVPKYLYPLYALSLILSLSILYTLDWVLSYLTYLSKVHPNHPWVNTSI